MRAPPLFKILLLGCLLTILGLHEMGVPSSAHSAEIAILKSSDISAYNQAVDAFKATASGATTFVDYNLQGDVALGRKLARKIRASDANLVLAVGLKAALAAKLEILDIPVIFCMVLDPARSDLPAPNMTGILLETPVDRQFGAIRSVLPRAKRIGVLYDPEKTATLVEQARRFAKGMGFELVEQRVRSEKEVPASLRMILPQIEALWLIPDSTVLTEESIGFLLGTALDAKVPVIGFSSDLVRRGALLGLSTRYEDVGRQAGAMAKRILQGQAPPTPAAVPPERLRLALNLKTARYLGIEIPLDVVNRADEAY